MKRKITVKYVVKKLLGSMHTVEYLNVIHKTVKPSLVGNVWEVKDQVVNVTVYSALLIRI